MLRLLTISILTGAWSASAVPFPQATSGPVSGLLRFLADGIADLTLKLGSSEVLLTSGTASPTSTPNTDNLTFTGVEVTNPPYQSLLAANTLFEGSNIAIVHSDTTFLARIGTFTGYNGPAPTALPTTVTNAEAFEVSPTHLEIVMLDPASPDALVEGYSCHVQDTTLNCTIIDYTANTTEIATVYSAIYQVVPTEVMAPIAPSSQVLNAAVDNDQLATLFSSAFSRIEKDAATATPTVDYVSVIESLQSSLEAAQSSVFESLRTAAPTLSASSAAASTGAA